MICFWLSLYHEIIYIHVKSYIYSLFLHGILFSSQFSSGERGELVTNCSKYVPHENRRTGKSRQHADAIATLLFGGGQGEGQGEGQGSGGKGGGKGSGKKNLKKVC